MLECLSNPVIVGGLCFIAGTVVGAAIEAFCLFDKTFDLVMQDNDALKAENKKLRTWMSAFQKEVIRQFQEQARGTPVRTAVNGRAYEGEGLS